MYKLVDMDLPGMRSTGVGRDLSGQGIGVNLSDGDLELIKNALTIAASDCEKYSGDGTFPQAVREAMIESQRSYLKVRDALEG